MPITTLDAEPANAEAPARKAAALTPNDAADLATETRALYVGTGGNLSVILSGDTAAVTFTNVAAGYHPLRVKRLRATGTTATGIVGLS
jgi:hypothetical protein